MPKSADIYIRHMLDAIKNIEADIKGHDFESFRADRRTRQLVERNLEIISEASRRLPQDLKDIENAVPWKQIAGIGNVIRHDYHTVFPTALWQTCRKELKPLKLAIMRIAQVLAADGKKAKD